MEKGEEEERVRKEGFFAFGLVTRWAISIFFTSSSQGFWITVLYVQASYADSTLDTYHVEHGLHDVILLTEISKSLHLLLR